MGKHRSHHKLYVTRLGPRKNTYMLRFLSGSNMSHVRTSLATCPVTSLTLWVASLYLDVDALRVPKEGLPHTARDRSSKHV